MKVLPIGGYYRTSYTTTNNSVTKNTTQNTSTNMQNPINFTGLQACPIDLLKKIPLEERLASIFNIMKAGDVVITAPTLKGAQKALKDASANFDNVLKRFFYVGDDGIKGSMTFFKNSSEELEALNTNGSDILLKNFLTGINDDYKMKPNDSFYVVPGDVITVGGQQITIKENSKTDLGLYRRFFASSFDLTEEVKPAIKNINIKSILSLVKPDGIKGKTLSFSDVGGQDSVINELKKTILYPIKYPEAYENSIVNHGFILYGPPGTGKTLIAQALANETNANFVKLNGLEMESKWVGESESNWRTLFDTARENQPSIIFIDEFDAVAKKRGGADVYGDKVVNQILTLMSDIEKNGDDIFVITATNKLNMLDDAIIRSGRFGKHIEVKAPNTKESVTQIFDIHSKNKPLAADVSKDEIAEKLLEKQANGADIAYIVNNAHENAFERSGIYTKMENGTFTKADIDALEVTREDFINAIDAFNTKSSANPRRPIGYNK